MDELRPRYLHVRLSSGFERWDLVFAPGEERETDAAEWADTLVTIKAGTVEVGCVDGGHRTFITGDLLALGWLPLRWIRNPGPSEARLTAVRRPGHTASRRPTRRFVRVRKGSPGSPLESPGG
ncbi:MAG TPA: hypothetical protein VEX62_03800 [Candidatus Limnocylindrales bacterium]|nr:hypothetical protein [Candidatus Limnocylindrales bacterium]